MRRRVGERDVALVLLRAPELEPIGIVVEPNNLKTVLFGEPRKTLAAVKI